LKASRADRADLVPLLLEAGANIEAKDMVSLYAHILVFLQKTLKNYLRKRFLRDFYHYILHRG
jgi:hypothetical protein